MIFLHTVNLALTRTLKNTLIKIKLDNCFTLDQFYKLIYTFFSKYKNIVTLTH